MIKVAFIGSGVLAQHIAHYINNEPEYTIAGFYDDFRNIGDEVTYGNILGPLSQIIMDYNAKKFSHLIIGIGYNHSEIRKALFEKLSPNIPFATYIHPSCFTDISCKIGNGVIALPGCIFDMNVTVTDNVFFNIGCHIAHDSIIESHNFFGPAVKLAGFVRVGQGCFVGINTTVIDNIAICAGTKTGGGAVITKSVTSPGLYAGVPAKLLKHKKE